MLQVELIIISQWDRDMKQFFILIVCISFLSSACTLSQRPSILNQSSQFISGPAVRVDASLLSQSRDEACSRIANHEVRDVPAGANAAGMLLSDFVEIRNKSEKLKVIATFRDSNPACLPHLMAGVQSKPHAILQKTWDSSNLLSQDEHKAGLVSNLMIKPPKGEKVADPRLTLYKGAAVTCDYDLMDLAESGGDRIPGESAREMEVREAFNRSIPPTVLGHRDRVMHGSQAGYRDYVMLHTDEPVMIGLFRPEAPVTAFSHSGIIFRLESIESVLDFYRCYRISLPAEWNVEMEDRSTASPKRIRLR